MGFGGFASVELLMAVEATFGLSIPDGDAERIRTVGELRAAATRDLRRGLDSTAATRLLTRI